MTSIPIIRRDGLSTDAAPRRRRSLGSASLSRRRELQPNGGAGSPGLLGERRDGPCRRLPLVAPLVLAYEAGVALASGGVVEHDHLRTGADAWMRRLAGGARADRPLVPAAGPAHDPPGLAGRAAEGVAVLADDPRGDGDSRASCWRCRLVGISRLSISASRILRADHRSGSWTRAADGCRDTRLRQLIGFLGAGVYEEALFRLLLVPISLRALAAPADAAGAGERPGGDRLGAPLLAGAPRGQSRRGVHLVRVRLPLDGGGLLRLGVRPPRIRDRGRHAHRVRYPGRLGRLARLNRPRARRHRRATPGCHLGTPALPPDSTRPRLRHPLLALRFQPCAAVQQAACLGMASLLVRRARRFRLERLRHVVDRVRRVEPDHILITGDLTTTALPSSSGRAGGVWPPWLRRSQRGHGHPRQPRPLHRSAPHRDRQLRAVRSASSPARPITLAATARRPDGDPRPGPHPCQPRRRGKLARARNLHAARELGARRSARPAPADRRLPLPARRAGALSGRAPAPSG